MEEIKLRIVVCEYTNKEVVQEKWDNEWVCIHGDTPKEDQELVEQIKKQIN